MAKLIFYHNLSNKIASHTNFAVCNAVHCAKLPQREQCRVAFRTAWKVAASPNRWMRSAGAKAAEQHRQKHTCLHTLGQGEIAEAHLLAAHNIMAWQYPPSVRHRSARRAEWHLDQPRRDR